MREEGREGGREGHAPVHRAHLNVVDRVNVLHCVLHHLTHLLQSSVRAQSRHCAPLNQHVALCQQLHCLQSDRLDGRQVRGSSPFPLSSPSLPPSLLSFLASLSPPSIPPSLLSFLASLSPPSIPPSLPPPSLPLSPLHPSLSPLLPCLPLSPLHPSLTANYAGIILSIIVVWKHRSIC